MDVAEARKLTGYCGLFCGESGLYKGRIMADVASDLKELMEAHTLTQDWLSKFFGIDFNFDEFRKGLDYFANENSDCYPKVPCKGGCGAPCRIKDCAEKRGIEICFECSEFPCKRFSRFEDKERLEIIEECERFKELGMAQWLKSKMCEAKKGYCRATRKYYSKAKAN